MIQFWWRSRSRFGSGSPKSEILVKLFIVNSALNFVLPIGCKFGVNLFPVMSCQYPRRLLSSSLVVLPGAAVVWGPGRV